MQGALPSVAPRSSFIMNPLRGDFDQAAADRGAGLGSSGAAAAASQWNCELLRRKPDTKRTSAAADMRPAVHKS